LTNLTMIVLILLNWTIGSGVFIKFDSVKFLWS